MKTKKGRGAKPPAEPRVSQSVKASSFDSDSHNLSAVDKASFLEGLQGNHGNVLHSTAMEEELNLLVEGQTDREKAGRKVDLQVKAKRRGASTKRKNTETDEDEAEKRGRRSTGPKAVTRPDKEGDKDQKMRESEGERNEAGVNATNRRLVGKKPAKGTGPGKTKAVRLLKHQRVKDIKRKSESKSDVSSDPESQDSDTDVDQQRHRRVLSSEEVDDDTSWDPSSEKAKLKGFGRKRQSLFDGSKSRKSSSGSASAEVERSNTDKQRRKKHGRQPGTDTEVVLDAFLDFCDQYKESVESRAVKESINLFSYNVKEQLMEKISLYKELRVLKRENAKVGSLIRTKTQRLFDAKQELMRAERQVMLLQKERSELKLRLADLRRSHTFLHDLRELNKQYLDHRHQHPKEQETYGASSLPALLLEAKHIQTTEHQLRRINDRMEKSLEG